MLKTEWFIPIIVFGPFVGAGVALLLGRMLGRQLAALMVAIAAISFTLGVLALSAPPLVFVREWIPGLNIALSFRADPFGILFASLISGIGTLVGLYSWTYIPELPAARLGRYYAALLAFMGSMLGVALADDLMLLFVFWEITSISSFLLIGFWYEQESARKGALTALQVTALGGLVMMVGFLMLGLITGTFSLTKLAQPEIRQQLAASPLLVPTMLLILVGALTKSAQWPFHFWLPGAMVAPTPVSTYLHAATMVKAGIFLMGRIFPLFSGTPEWANVLVPLGLITFLLGAMQAFVDTDLKGILAKTTLSTLGLVTMLYGLGAAGQDALQILTHATYKGALFLVVGIVEHATHTRDIRQLGGLRAKMPITFIVGLLAAASMMGLPPFFGFLAKESLYGMLITAMQPAGHGPVLTGPVPIEVILGLIVLANAFIFAVGCRIIIRVFLGNNGSHTHHAHEAGIMLWLPPAILASLALGFGLMAPAAEYVANTFSSAPAGLHIALIPTHMEPVWLSLATMTLGIMLFLLEPPVVRWCAANKGTLTMQRVWDDMLALVTKIAISFSIRWQNGSLRWYLSGSLLFTVLLSGFAMWRGNLGIRHVPISLAEASWYGIALCVFLSVSAIMVVQSTTRLAAALALTANGFITGLTFVLYHSPDILLTQILIETVSTVFLLLILYRMPIFRSDGLAPLQRFFNLSIAVAVGFIMFSFIMLSTSPHFRETKNLAADYFARSLTDAGGANAVNVIIVDFRAMDTNGEIAVLVMVGLIVFGLMNARRRAAV